MRAVSMVRRSVCEIIFYYLEKKVLKQIEKCSLHNEAKSEKCWNMSKINSFRNCERVKRFLNWLIGSEQTTGMSTPGRGKSSRGGL